MQRSRKSVLPHWIRLYLPPLEIKNIVRVPSRMKLAKNPHFSSQFQQIYGEFLLFVLKYILSLLLKMIKGASWPAKIMEVCWTAIRKFFPVKHSVLEQVQTRDSNAESKSARVESESESTKHESESTHHLSLNPSPDLLQHCKHFLLILIKHQWDICGEEGVQPSHRVFPSQQYFAVYKAWIWLVPMIVTPGAGLLCVVTLTFKLSQVSHQIFHKLKEKNKFFWHVYHL